MRKYICLVICCLLTACSAGKMTTSGGEIVPAPTHAELRTAFSALPGARVPESEPLRVLFPVGALFAQGSVLPMPGGTGLLDAIAELLKKSELSWQLTVRAASGQGVEQDRVLVDARISILKTYLQAVGLNLRNLRFKGVVEDGAPLELQISK